MSIPVKGERDRKEEEHINFVRKIGVTRMMEIVVNHHLRFINVNKRVESKGKEISNIILLLNLLYLILMSVTF